MADEILCFRAIGVVRKNIFRLIQHFFFFGAGMEGGARARVPLIANSHRTARALTSFTTPGD